MAKKLLVNYKGEEAEFDFKKIDRAKLYGKRKRVYLDASDNECQRAELTSDGSTEVRLAPNEKAALKIGDGMIEKNIKKGWTQVVRATNKDLKVGI